MPKTRRTAYIAAFKLKAIDLAIEKGNRSAAHELGVNESMIRRWRKQRGELSRCKKTTKAFRGKPAYEMMENDPDWAPTLHMGHSENENGDTPRSAKSQKLALRSKRIQEGQGSSAEEPMQCKEAATWNVKQEEESYEIVKWEVKPTGQTECGGEGCGIGAKEVKQEEKLIQVVKQEAGQMECDFCIQRAAEVSRLVEENRQLRRELDAFKMPDGFFEDDDNKVEYYTGMPSVGSFMHFFCFLLPLMSAQESKLSPFQVLLLTFMRLRLDLPAQHLAHIFSISTGTVDRTFQDTVSFLYTNLRPSITWPDRNTLQRTMPQQFVEAFGRKAVAVVDCLKVLAHKSSRHKEHQMVPSDYAVKYLIAVTPSGFVGFVSKGCDGFTGAKNMLVKSGFLNKLLPGDVILAVGFDADQSGGLFCAEVDVPTFAHTDCHLAEKNLGETAHLLEHIGTLLGSIHRKYKLLKAAVPVDMTLPCDREEVTFLDKMVTVCYALENHCPTAV
ncbi:uncharacterized protein LOC133471778 isoform X2 [Phyllopteryx taeniolatus]|uniref:uncharacterized protein LOC133471778 isoform X2 n=1 Tax=Phyllopteryx taeniolatus TaxID=161469 RepID=UPI002AD4BA4C|nr:uncharacterized protein LOC133471778 isoform X2 [Phyllopteryx taeniolatus]